MNPNNRTAESLTATSPPKLEILKIFGKCGNFFQLESEWMGSQLSYLYPGKPKILKESVIKVLWRLPYHEVFPAQGFVWGKFVPRLPQHLNYWAYVNTVLPQIAVLLCIILQFFAYF